MYVRSIAGTATRLAMILLFVLALAGCGDSGDTDPHGHEHADEFPGRLMVMDAENQQVQVFDLQSEEVVGEGFPLNQSTAPGSGTLLRRTSNGRYGFLLQRTGHFSPDHYPTNPPEVLGDVIRVIDSGLKTDSHGDHADPERQAPSLLPYELGHGSGEMDEMGLYRPIHWSSHHGHTTIFYDGSVDWGEDGSILDSVNGYAVAYEDSDWGGGMRPDPIFKLDVGSYAHGGAVAFHHKLFIVSVGMNEGYGGLAYSTLPRGVAVYRGNPEDEDVDVDDFIPGQDFRGSCPRLHGEAVSGNYVAFGCNEGPEDNDNPNYTGPMITDRSGVLVLSYDANRDENDEPPFEAAEVAYPEYPEDLSETTSGGLRGGTGPSEGIIMTTYGQDHFLKIMAAELEYGPPEDIPINADSTSLLEVEMGSGGNRGYYIEPVDHNYPLGEGRFVVLTRTGNLHIFDLTMPAGYERVGSVLGIVGDTRESCPDVGCPSFALAPGFAYVTDPANNMVYEVFLGHAEEDEDPEIKRMFDLNAPTSLVVLGWFEDADEIEFEHE